MLEVHQMTLDISTVISELEREIIYFKNLGFDNLAIKFERDLTAIKQLLQNNNTVNGEH